MNRVLVTGGAGTIGAAVVRRLLRDPDWEVRVSDQRSAPTWMREACEVHTGDLRELDEAREAAHGCTHVVHLAAIVGGIRNFHELPHTLLEVNNALYNTVFRAALEQRVERLVYVSSSMVFERATEFPTTEAHLDDCPTPRSAYGFSKLAGEVYCRSLHAEHGLPFEIFGSGGQTRTLTHVDDIADGIATVAVHPAAQNEDFNISASRELTVAEIARVVWEAC